MEKILKNKGLIIELVLYVLCVCNCLFRYKQDASKYVLLQRILVVTSIAALVLWWTLYIRKRREVQRKSAIDYLIDYRYFLCLSFLVLFCILGIHGFSLDQWAKYLGYESKWGLTLWGTGRAIQSDVWAIGIPQLLNQIANGFPIFNYDMMSQGGNVTLSGMPGMGLTFIGQPHFWGCLLGARVGLAWLYWFRKFALLLGAYEVFVFLLKGKRDYALVGALVITTSPLMNWWFGHTVSTVVIYAFWCVACVINYLKYRDNLPKKIMCAVLGGIGAIGYVFGWYPALQVPFGYFVLILVVAVFVRYKRENGVLFDKQDAIILGITFVSVIAILGQYLYISADSIRQLTSTAYPGKRVCVGGEYVRDNIAYYAFQPLFGKSLMAKSNYCEASSVMPFLPIVYVAALVVIIRSIRKHTIKEHILLIVLFAYDVLITSWLFVPYPTWFAKITLFSYVAGKRSVWSLSIIAACVGMMCLKELVEDNQKEGIKLMTAIVSSVVATGVLFVLTHHYRDEAFITKAFTSSLMRQYLIAFGALLVFNFFYMWGKKKVVLILLTVMSIYFEATISPVEMGTGYLTHSSLANEIKKIEKEDPEATWIADGAFVNANYVYAQGVHVYNTTNQYMDSEKWKFFEERGASEDIYNRYAQVMVNFTEEASYIQLCQADLIGMWLNLNDLDELGINYIATHTPIEDTNWKELVELMYVDAVNGMRIYKVVSQ